MTAGARVALGVYERLLHLYPPAFSRRFAKDMSLDFRDALTSSADARVKGACVASFYGDLFVTVPAQWARVDAVRVFMLSAGGLGVWWLGVVQLAQREWPHGPSFASLFQAAAATALSCLAMLVRHQTRPSRTLSLLG